MAVEEKRIIFIGSTCSGKTSLIHQLLYHEEPSWPYPTTGASISSYRICKNNISISFLLYDTQRCTGHFAKLVSLLMGKGDIIIIVYDPFTINHDFYECLNFLKEHISASKKKVYILSHSKFRLFVE